MNANELRKKFIEFFEGKDHKVIPSASLVPETEVSETDKTLFTTAGMQPLVPYLIGEKHPKGNKLVNLQKCFRTGDIDEVGDESHLTFFEMMGYWSLGDYWKKEAINYTFEFLTKELKIDQGDLAVTCFAGEGDIPKDEESADIWRSLGFLDNRIAFLGKEDNFWGPAATEGPCGPDSEVFVWTGADETPEKFDPENRLWMEIGNDVFMQYNKTKEGKFELLKQRNVDFGAGYERIISYLEGKSNVYETELFEPIISKIEEISSKKYYSCHPEASAEGSGESRSFRIIADHIKAATFAISDGVFPSNKGAGYIVRRLIRRAIVKAHQLGVKENFTTKLADVVFDIYEGVYYSSSESEKSADSSRQVSNNIQDDIKKELEKEEGKFRKTLENGLLKIDVLSKNWVGFKKENGEVDLEKEKATANEIWDLYQSNGFPVELSLEELKRRNIDIDDQQIKQVKKLVEIYIKEHQELSRTASAGMFKGGLADAGEIAVKYHTATHLLHQALRQVLGEHVQQKGSNITAERLRFDFVHTDKMTPEQIAEVENIVNEQIKKDLPVTMEEMTVEDAKNSGALGFFEHKYGDKVKVYTIGESTKGESPSTRDARSGSREFFSREICGGPHVSHTGELGHFKIKKEESSSAGIRRIKAVLE